ncbi:MAG: NAD-dependent epimerase/dehydratase family protein [Candidatus Omnitrophica bacterium]|nr:NAD-dependent epimerase/dehydratase family protein [Candidatus Omnitrophota bacterium]
MEWSKKKVLVTGGASFIGSHLVEALVDRGAFVRVADNLTSGILDNIKRHIDTSRIEFLKGDLRDTQFTSEVLRDMQIVFHLAADHGGRGYVDLHQAGPATNLLLDGNIFWQSVQRGIEKVVFASSGCVYPNYLQNDVNKEVFLTEDMVQTPYDADNMYGWAKLMGELTLKAYHKEYGLKAASCRYFTVFGPRGKENHAVIAMIARAFLQQDPFEVWGDGEQVRNWTYIDDIVRGTILAAERIDDATAINLGASERIRVKDAVAQILRYTKHSAHLCFRNDMPVGPRNRVADNALAEKLLGWCPEVSFHEGLQKTIDWYFSSKNKEQVALNFSETLIRRTKDGKEAV